MKRWPVHWQTMVTRFVEKRTEMGRGEERGDISGSGGGEFLCPECGDVFPEHGKLKCHRGKAHGVRWPAARFVRDGVCPHCRVNFHCRARAMAHLEKGSRRCREALMEASWWSSRRRSSKRRRIMRWFGTADKRVWKGPTLTWTPGGGDVMLERNLLSAWSGSEYRWPHF